MTVAPHPSIDTLDQRLVFARERAGLTTAQLARRLGIQTRTLTRWQSGRSEPRPNRLVMLAQMLGVSPAWLLEGSIGFAPENAEPSLADIGDKLVAAKRAIENLSAIVDGLSVLVEQEKQPPRRDAA